jgi:predicted ribosome quality control (RQC) complex YloA/Tae2 family protein
LRALAHALDHQLKGAEVQEIFSQTKDELVIRLEHPETHHEYWLVFSGATQFTYLMAPERFYRKKQNTVNLFSGCLGRSVKQMGIIHHDRVLTLELTDGTVVWFKLYHLKPNVVAVYPDQRRELFIRQRTADLAFRPPHYRMEPWDRLSFEVGLAAAGRNTFAERLKYLYPCFDKYTIERINTLSQAGASEWEAAQQVLEELEHASYWVCEPGVSPPEFRLMPAHQEPQAFENTTVRVFTDVVSSLQHFVFATHAYNRFQATHAEVRNRVERVVKDQTRVYVSVRKSIEQLEGHRSKKDMADVLMAYGHLTPIDGKLTVDDFLTGKPETFVIPGHLSVIEQAQELYKSWKAEQALLLSYYEKEEALTQRYHEAQSLATAFEQVNDGTGLQIFLKQHPQLKPASKATKHRQSLPFHQFEKQGHTIWIGKNARSNDVLTTKYAHPNDYWLHVKDSPGSHVVVRQQQAGRLLPEPVLHYAAQLAAYFSKERNNTLVAVSYTLRKFIRKNKRMAIGEVALLREKNLLVAPAPPDEVLF